MLINERITQLSSTTVPTVNKFPNGITDLQLTASKDVQAVLELLPFVLIDVEAAQGLQYIKNVYY